MVVLGNSLLKLNNKKKTLYISAHFYYNSYLLPRHFPPLIIFMAFFLFESLIKVHHTDSQRIFDFLRDTFGFPICRMFHFNLSGCADLIPSLLKKKLPCTTKLLKKINK